MNHRENIYRESFHGAEENESLVSWGVEAPYHNRFSYVTQNIAAASAFNQEALGLGHVIVTSLRKRLG